MFKKVLIALAVITTGLIGSCALMLGGAAYRDAPANKAVAMEATRVMSRAWNMRDLRPYFTSDAVRQINFDKAQANMNVFKALGELVNVKESRQTEFHYNKQLGSKVEKKATVVIEAVFENGPATITVRLANDGAVMKVVHIHVHAPGPLKARQAA